MGAVETLIVWENLDVTRHYLRDSTGSEIIVHTHAPPAAANTSKVVENQSGINALSEVDRAKFIDKVTGLEMEQSRESQPMLEWLAENYTSMGAQLEVSLNYSKSRLHCIDFCLSLMVTVHHQQISRRISVSFLLVCVLFCFQRHFPSPFFSFSPSSPPLPLPLLPTTDTPFPRT